MRSRMAAALGIALIGSGVTALGMTLAADAAGEGVRLYLHSAGGGYANDVATDPSATLDTRAPAGSTADDKPPTKTTSATATVRPTANAAISGQPDTPSFNLPVTGTVAVASVCLDLFASGPSGASISVFGYLSDDHDTKIVDLTELKVTPYPGGVVRLTGSVTPTAAFTATKDAAIGFFAGDLNGPGSNVVLNYDSVTHPSNVTVNPASCTPVPVATPSGSPSGSASATASASVSATAAPSATSTVAPSGCPTTSASPAASVSATASATPAATASVTASATAATTATPTPSVTASATAAVTPSPTPAAIVPKQPTPTTSATPSATASATVGPTVSPSASVSASATVAPTATPSTSPTAAPTPGPTAPPTDGCNIPRRITLNVDEPRITAGNRPTLFGEVTDDLNKPVAGGRVDIFAKGYGQPAYTRVGTVLTDSEGRYALRVAPTRQTAYGAHAAAARSRVIVVRVHTRVDITRPAPGPAANPVTFAGQLTPRFANVAVGLGYLTGGRFVVLTQTRTTATGSYTMTRALPRGTFTFVVFTSAHEGTDKGSKSVRLTVR